MKTLILSLAAVIIMSSSVFAWDGYDYENAVYIEIGKGNLVRNGETIEIYDYGEGEYKEVEIESILLSAI